MNDYQNFSSLPPEKERDFVIYEKTSVEAGQKAWRIGMIAAVSFGVLVVAIVFGIGAKPKNKMADDDLGMLKRAEKKETKTKAAAPTPDKPADSTGSAADTPDEAGAAGGDSAGGDKGAAADGAKGDSADGEKADSADGKTE
jgi:hypothetical protein